jgi:hypothetical protein
MTPERPTRYLVVGCGGVASYFLPSFLRTVAHTKGRKPGITLMDGDTLEEKNLIRQNFDKFESVSKPEAMKKMYSGINGGALKINTRNTYFSSGEVIDSGTCVLCFVDNHLARKHVLESIDESEGTCGIFAANSTISAHSYFYMGAWKGNPWDPRVMFPEIETDTSGSPLNTGGCNTDRALDDIPQTAIANQMAAACALLAWNVWCNTVPTFTEELSQGDFERLPVEFFTSGVSMSCKKIKDTLTPSST